jgi:hypothetical protein
MDRRNHPVPRFETSIPIDSNLPVVLLRQIFVEERRQLAEVLFEHGWIRDRADPKARYLAVARQDPPTALN